MGWLGFDSSGSDRPYSLVKGGDTKLSEVPSPSHPSRLQTLSLRYEGFVEKRLLSDVSRSSGLFQIITRSHVSLE